MNQKGFYRDVIVVILALALGVVGYWYIVQKKSADYRPVPLTPPVSQNRETGTNNETAELPVSQDEETGAWKTYRNEKYGFELEYPSEWKYGEEIRSDNPWGYRIYLRPITDVPADDTYGLIQVVVYKIDISLSEFINTYLCDSPGVCAFAETATDLAVGNIPAKRVINPPAPVPSEVVVLKKDAYIFDISIKLDKSYEELYSLNERKDIFNKIISTFRFIN